LFVGEYMVWDPISDGYIPTGYKSIVDSMYWAAITMCTVGYGELFTVIPLLLRG
jgi:hypothetical protein